MSKRYRRSLWIAGAVSLLTLEVALGAGQQTLFWALNATAGLALGGSIAISLHRMTASFERWTASPEERKEPGGDAPRGGDGRTRRLGERGTETKEAGTQEAGTQAETRRTEAQRTETRGTERPFFRDDPNVTEIHEIFPYARYDRSRPFD